MASVAFRCKMRGHQCVIITEDKDLWQCLGSGVVMYSSRNHEFRNEDWLYSGHHLKPEQVVDYLCMVGKDDSPSCRGIGDKHATDLLRKFGNFWEIYLSAALDEKSPIPKKRRETILEFARSGEYFTAHHLHTLVKNLEVKW